MGNTMCSLCGTRSKATVKLILLDGHLKEFPDPVKVSSLLQKESNDSFICDSDKMDFEELVMAMDGEEELQPGQLYFELPLTLLSQRLQPEDMASLAVKASAALTRGEEMIKCGWCYRPKRIDPRLIFYDNEEDHVKLKQEQTRSDSVFESPNYELVSLKKKRGGVSNLRFTTKLSVILEEEY